MATVKYLADLDLTGGQLLNVILQSLASAPSSPGAGRIYFDSSMGLARYHNGSAWIDLTPDDGDAATLDGEGPSFYLNRTNHTGSQAIGTISGLQSALDSKTDDSTFNNHSARHEDGGADEINVGGLSGELADPQTPKSHGNEAHSTNFASQADLNSHTSDTSNPHNVTAGQVGAIPTSQKGAANGVAELDGSGTVPASQIPAIAIGETFAVSSESAMLALDAHIGDVAIRSDTDSRWLLVEEPPTDAANWHELGSADDVVESVSAGAGISLSGSPSNVTVSATFAASEDTTDVGSSSDEGTVDRVARADHTHDGVRRVMVGPGLSISGPTDDVDIQTSFALGGDTTTIGTSNSEGMQSRSARADHRHSLSSATQGIIDDADDHHSDTTNPHNVTAAQTGALPTAGGTMSGRLNLHAYSETQTVSSASTLTVNLNSGNHLFRSTRSGALTVEVTNTGSTNEVRLATIVLEPSVGAVTWPSGIDLDGPDTVEKWYSVVAIGSTVHIMEVGGGGDVNKHEETITNPGTSESVTHNLGTSHPVVQTYLDNQKVECEVTIDNDNEITLGLSSAVTGSLKVVVL